MVQIKKLHNGICLFPIFVLLFTCPVVGYCTEITFASDTVPASLPATSDTRFAVIGDYGTDGADLGELNVANLVAGWTPEFVITVGDNRYDPATMDSAVGKYYCDFLADAGVGTWCSGGNASVNAFFPSPGNHEYTDGGGINEYLDYFTLPGSDVVSSGTSANERYYDFIQGPVHFFVLDSAGAERSEIDLDTQKTWLQEQLTASTSLWQIVYFHHPPYSSSSRHGTSTFMQWPFTNWGADAVLAGHDHIYERLQIDGIPYFVNGLGGDIRYDIGVPVAGSIIRYNENFGAMLVEAGENDLKFQFINVDGVVVDTHTVQAIPPQEGVLDFCIVQSSDDAEERVSDGKMHLTSSDLDMVYDPWVEVAGDQVVGIRFQNVNVPQKAEITSAYLEFTTDTADSVFTSVDIRAEAVDNATTFSSMNYDLSTRPTTGVNVAWEGIPSWDTSGEIHQTPDLSVLIQEVVDRDGWYAGNSLVFILSGTGTRTADAFDGSPSTSPRLHLEFTTPSVTARRTLRIIREENGGQGTVTSLPAGIDCGSQCIALYDTATEVTLRAIPGPSGKFAGWSGDADCADGVVTMSSNVSCRALFHRSPWGLYLRPILNGSSRN